MTMTAVYAERRTTPAPQAPAPARRDTSVDFLRAFCIVAVVALHAQMVGISAGAEGIAFFDASEGASWLVPFSWSVQVMPLFFIIGGFSGAIAYQRLRARGGRPSAFLSARVHRLLLPALVTIVAVGLLLVLLSMVGVPEEFVATARYRFGQPLWFLATFLMCQALLPALVRAHERAPWLTLGALAGGACTVDLTRALTGIDAIGLLNLALVWLTIQQLGFFLARGDVERLPRRGRIGALAVSVSVIVTAIGLGLYSPDLLANLNPPTTLLVLIGVAQLFLFSLCRPALARLADRRAARAFTAFVTPRAMTIYLWHMPVLLTMAGVLAAGALLGGTTLAEASSPAWWLARPLWIAVALALTAVIAVALAPVERRPLAPEAPSTPRAVIATMYGLAGLVLILTLAHSVFALFLGSALVLLALRTARAREAVAPAL